MPCSQNIEINFDGNLIDNKFMDIWNNDWYSNMRYRLLTGNPPQRCLNCIDTSVKDTNYIGSYFSEEILPYVLDYIEKQKDGELWINQRH